MAASDGNPRYVDIVFMAYRLATDPELGSAVVTAEQRANATEFWRDKVDAAKGDASFQSQLAAMTPKRKRRANKSA